ncbi:MAG: hypothetical protein KF845_01715 [Cyclobacteriaceae bacterium]|nr:hypothetical protein [Cyclobacteriaceae bacterium]
MKKILLVCLFICYANADLAAQIKWQHYSASVGVNLFTPTLIFRNENILRSHNLSWQAGINRDFEIPSADNIRVSLGITDNSFTIERPFIGGGTGVLVRKINIGYVHIEVDYILRKQMSSYIIYGGLGLRAGRVCYENSFSRLYSATGLKRASYGGNALLGIQFPNMPRKPSLQLNYYYSFTRAAYNSVRDNQGDVYTDELKNRAIGLQVFFNLKK